MALTAEEQDELRRLEAAFDEAGGRGVELAERIDELRARRERERFLITVQVWVWGESAVDAENMAIDVADHASEINEDPDAPGSVIQTCIAQKAPFQPLGEQMWTGVSVEEDMEDK
jgi:hypothetical protein